MSFQYPVPGAPGNKTQGFGENPAYYKQFNQIGHNGIDYGVPIGTPVYAKDEGVISFEGWGQKHSWMLSPAGICVLINHGGSYGGDAHLSSTVVNIGQHVNKGQLIGYSGQTGAATGPHTHDEMLPLNPNFKNGFAGRIDPTPYYDQPAVPPANNPPVTGGDDMIDLPTLDLLYRFVLRRPDGVNGDQGAIDHYVGRYATNFVVKDLADSPEHAQAFAAEQNTIDSLNGRISDLTSQLASAQSNDQEDINAIATLHQEVTAVTAERDAKQASLDAANKTIEDLKAEPAPTPVSQDPAGDAFMGGVRAFFIKAGQFINQVIRLK